MAAGEGGKERQVFCSVDDALVAARSVPRVRSTNDRSSGLGRREVEVQDALPLTWCLLASSRTQWAAAQCCWPAWATGCGAAAAGVPAPAWCTATRSLPRAWLEQCPRGSTNTTPRQAVAAERSPSPRWTAASHPAPRPSLPPNHKEEDAQKRNDRRKALAHTLFRVSAPNHNLLPGKKSTI